MKEKYMTRPTPIPCCHFRMYVSVSRAFAYKNVRVCLNLHSVEIFSCRFVDYICLQIQVYTKYLCMYGNKCVFYVFYVHMCIMYTCVYIYT